jgi:UDP-N-acetylmuramoylalanine--D-glutamate ligase
VTVVAFDVTNAHVVVIGAERSGCAAAELLVSRGARVTMMDATGVASARRARLAALGVPVLVGPHDAAVLATADLVVLSPGVPPGQAAVASARDAGIPVIGELELASRWIHGRTVAITGTKGKSTTTTLAARMLEQAGRPVTAGGNLGTPLSAQVEASTPDVVHVVEVSSFQLETTDTFHPWIAVLLNLSPDHLDRHASFEEYAAAKARLFRNQEATDWAIVNADDPAALALARGGSARRFDFALDAPITEGVTVVGGHVVERVRAIDRPLLPVSAVRLPGRHLLADVLAAAAVGCLAGVPAEAMRRAVEQFSGLEHTLELVVEVGGVRFVNDSKATNVASARRALESFDGGVVAIMGGRYKGGRFEELRDVARSRVRAVIAIGEAAPLIASAIGSIVPVTTVASMSEAVRRAYALAEPGGVVLLAPGCSSFDMFTDFAQRGRAFKDEARRLAAAARTGHRPV